MRPSARQQRAGSLGARKSLSDPLFCRRKLSHLPGVSWLISGDVDLSPSVPVPCCLSLPGHSAQASTLAQGVSRRPGIRRRILQWSEQGHQMVTVTAPGTVLWSTGHPTTVQSPCGRFYFQLTSMCRILGPGQTRKVGWPEGQVGAPEALEASPGLDPLLAAWTSPRWRLLQRCLWRRPSERVGAWCIPSGRLPTPYSQGKTGMSRGCPRGPPCPPPGQLCREVGEATPCPTADGQRLTLATGARSAPRLLPLSGTWLDLRGECVDATW